jgi:ABC-type Mn2+/Zn2+ transport system ATPase subunit
VKLYERTLTSAISKSFHCRKAANSLDIDIEKKSTHHIKIEADVESPFDVGLIVGASGSGKTQLARLIYGSDFDKSVLDLKSPVIDQFPDAMTYDQRAAMLTGAGLTAVMTWIRPAATLSNGQRARADIALRLAQPGKDYIVVDEWTSVVDRTVAKVMSHCVQKFARKNGRRVVLVSCHYDVVEWLQPDWVIDCNKQTFTNWRVHRPARKEKLRFDIREVGGETWPYFSQYHYLSDRLPGGIVRTFGLFHGDDQIGFQCFANYVPPKPPAPVQMHSNRTVIHPDYAGMGLGIMLITETSKMMAKRGYDVRAKFSSIPVAKAMLRDHCWELLDVGRKHEQMFGGTIENKGQHFRLDVRTFSFRFDQAGAEARAAQRRDQAGLTTVSAASASARSTTRARKAR